MNKLIATAIVCLAIPALAQEKPLTQEQVQGVVNKNMSDLKSCMKEHGSPTGKLIVEITVGPDGKVKQSRPTHDSSNAGVDKCLAQAITHWSFPKPRGGADFAFDYPFVFAAPKASRQEGTIDAKAVEKTVTDKIPEWKKCYDDAVKEDKDVGGTVKVGMVIAPDGKVSEAHVLESNTKAPKLDACVLARVKTWVFPKPQGGEASIAYPFWFVHH